jgi:hypothetical protein
LKEKSEQMRVQKLQDKQRHQDGIAKVEAKKKELLKQQIEKRKQDE